MSDTQIYVRPETREKLEILAKRDRRTLAATVEILVEAELGRRQIREYPLAFPPLPAHPQDAQS